MIDVDPKLPRPVNHGAVTLVAVLSLGAVWLGGSVGMIPPLEGYSCAPPPSPVPMGLLCGGLTLVGLFGPLFVLLPPTDPPVNQDEDGLAWTRPRVGVGTTFLTLAWSVWLSAALMGLTVPQVSLDPMCDFDRLSPGEREMFELDWQWFYGSWITLIGIGLALAVRIARSRRVRTVELDGRGVHVDGVRLPFNDIDRLEVEDRALVIHGYDGAQTRIALWRRERDFAGRLAEAIRSHLPEQAEARNDSRARLAGVTAQGSSRE